MYLDQKLALKIQSAGQELKGGTANSEKGRGEERRGDVETTTKNEKGNKGTEEQLNSALGGMRGKKHRVETFIAEKLEEEKKGKGDYGGGRFILNRGVRRKSPGAKVHLES